MAALHVLAFTVPRPWTATEFADLRRDPAVFEVHDPPSGFAVGRVAADEAELLTLAVAPADRRSGIGTRLLHRFTADARARGATRIVLEVAEDNVPARALYDRAGFALAGRRRAYYRAGDGGAVDALVLTKTLAETLG